MGVVLLTSKGLDSLQDELGRLARERAVLRERMRRALDHGGATAENGEYLDASRAWDLLERRTRRLEQRLQDAEVVEAERDGELEIGERVAVRNTRSGAVVNYRIVGSGEGDPEAGQISHESPVGSALLGRRVGDIVVAQAPRGRVRLEIMEIDE